MGASTSPELTEVVDRFLRRDVVDQRVKAAEFGDGLLHGALAVVFYGEVAADRHASLPGRSDQFRRAGRILVFAFGEVGEHASDDELHATASQHRSIGQAAPGDDPEPGPGG
jgi:hypothetical protein